MNEQRNAVNRVRSSVLRNGSPSRYIITCFTTNREDSYNYTLDPYYFAQDAITYTMNYHTLHNTLL